MAGADSDGDMIANVLVLQHVPVVGTITLDKLQLLLHSLCDRIASQAVLACMKFNLPPVDNIKAERLDKAEENSKTLASLKEELKLLCQNALPALNVDKAAEAEKQAKGLELFEARLKALEAERQGKESLEALEKRLKELEAENSKQGKNWEDFEKRLKEVEGGNQQEQGKNWGELEKGLKAPELLGGGGGLSEGVSGSKECLGTQSDVQAGWRGASGDGGSNFSTEELSEKIKQLEAQAEEFKALMQQVMKAHTADLEAIQKTQRMLRADLEAKPIGKSEGGNVELAELQKRLERKADVDIIDQLLRASTNNKEVIEALTKAVDDIKKDMRNSKFSTKIGAEPTVPVPLSGDIAIKPTDAGGCEGRCKKLEEELALLANKLSAKADRVAVDEMHFKLASGGGDGDGNGGDSAIKDLIAQKADRAEISELMSNARSTAAQVQSLGDLCNELKEKLNSLGSSVTALTERSDLAVLLAKRAEMIAHPVASLQRGSTTDDEEIQFVVNEHANRITVYSDMLLQLQVALANKADNTALAALRELIEKSGGELGGDNGKDASATMDAMKEMAAKNQMAWEAASEMRETVKSHEKMLMKLLEDVGVLGKGVLIMSGHDDEYQPASIPPSPVAGEGDGEYSTQPAPTSPSSSPPALAAETSTPPSFTVAPSAGATAAPPVYQNAAPPAVSAESTTGGPTSPAFSAQPTSPSYPTTPQNRSASPQYQSASSQRQPDSPRKEAAVHFTGQTPHSPGHRRIGTPQRGSSIRIKNVQEATQAVVQSKYRESLGVLEEALKEKKIEPKENVAVLKRLMIAVEKLSREVDHSLELLDTLEENKADKLDLQVLAKLVKELKAMDNAMLSGKPLLGFKCMSCNHDLEKLNATRGPYVPTGVMPRSFLSMLAAERIFSTEKREPSPPQTRPRTPPYDRTGDFVKIIKKITNCGKTSPKRNSKPDSPRLK